MDHFAREKHKIFNAVIIHDTIDMMNHFGGEKGPPKVGFHDEAVLKDIACLGSEGMIWSINPNISFAVKESPPFPIRVFFSMLTSVLTFGREIIYIFRLFHLILLKTMILMSTRSFPPFWSSLGKFLPTKSTGRYRFRGPPLSKTSFSAYNTGHHCFPDVSSRRCRRICPSKPPLFLDPDDPSKGDSLELRDPRLEFDPEGLFALLDRVGLNEFPVEDDSTVNG